jgi:O-acetyl-ADP-ribose deacetylase (regulator of RNase III)
MGSGAVKTVHNSRIELVLGDITELAVDAIVNPANERLVLGGGVAGTVRKKGGPEIQEQCNAIRHTPVGTAVITSGGQLKARYVIHAVGPRMGEGDEDAKLRGATLESLMLAEKYGIKSIAFPAISTGIFGYPIDRCARIMLNEVVSYLQGETTIEVVQFCLFDQDAFGVFERELKKEQQK